MQTNNCDLAPCPSLLQFDLDVAEIEDKLATMGQCNDRVNIKLHKVANGLQTIQKYLGSGHKLMKSKISKCPPARSSVEAAFISENGAIPCRDSMIPNTRGREMTRQDNIKCKSQSYRDRSHSDSSCRTGFDINHFPSSFQSDQQLSVNTRSLNSIFRVHETLNSTTRQRSSSAAVTPVTEKNSVKIYHLFQSNDDSSKPLRPTSFFFCQRSYPPTDHQINRKRSIKRSAANDFQSTQSLDDYLSSLSKDQSRKERSELAAKAIDSCLQLMMNLIN